MDEQPDNSEAIGRLTFIFTLIGVVLFAAASLKFFI